MIKHIVCFKLTDNSEEIKKETKAVLLSMKGKVPMINDIFVGVDFLSSPRSYDIILEVVLKDKQALEDYQNDKYHCEVVKEYMHAHICTSVAIDCEI